MQIGDYTAHIFVDNEGLEEYGVEFETPTRAVCWVASEEGKVTTHLASHPLFLPPFMHATNRISASNGTVRLKFAKKVTSGGLEWTEHFVVDAPCTLDA